MKSGRKNKKIRGVGKEFDRVKQVCELLNKAGAKYLLVGGNAVALHGHVRATKDVDLLIPKDLENSEKILNALGNLTWGIAKEIMPEEVMKKPWTIIGDLPRVDLLRVAKNVKFDAAYPKREEIIFKGVRIPYVCLDDLIASKQTDRLQDKADLEKLEYIKRKKLKKLRPGQNRRRSV